MSLRSRIAATLHLLASSEPRGILGFQGLLSPGLQVCPPYLSASVAHNLMVARAVRQAAEQILCCMPCSAQWPMQSGLLGISSAWPANTDPLMLCSDEMHARTPHPQVSDTAELTLPIAWSHVTARS